MSNWQGRLENQRGDSVYVLLSATPLLAEDGWVRRAVAAIVDISQQKHAEAQQQFLLTELQHRVKNILAAIGSLSTRMSRGQSSVEEFCSAFLGRLGAMGRTHDPLTEDASSGASLTSLVEAALEPLATAGKDTVMLEGPEIRLASDIATTLGMVLHELAMNASKYGAMSKPGRRVEIRWRQLDADPANPRRLELSWTERDGPPVEPSRLSGFGTGFITRSVEYKLGARPSCISPGGAFVARSMYQLPTKRNGNRRTADCDGCRRRTRSARPSDSRRRGYAAGCGSDCRGVA